MIFVTVGTTKFPFERMSGLIYSLAKDRYRNRLIVYQHGETPIGWRLKNVRLVKFLSDSRHKDMIKKSNIIICHGGPVTIYLSLLYGKQPFVIAREKKYGEHVNDHQLHFCKKLAQEKKIALVTNIDDFSKRRYLQRVPASNFKREHLVINFLDYYTQELAAH